MGLFTDRVMLAICKEKFQHSTLQWADDDAKEKAKAWVEDASCYAWQDGWLMVDGTLVPLFTRPEFYGNTWFDQKSNYSMNLQVHLLTEDPQSCHRFLIHSITAHLNT